MCCTATTSDSQSNVKEKEELNQNGQAPAKKYERAKRCSLVKGECEIMIAPSCANQKDVKAELV